MYSSIECLRQNKRSQFNNFISFITSYNVFCASSNAIFFMHPNNIVNGSHHLGGQASGKAILDIFYLSRTQAARLKFYLYPHPHPISGIGIGNAPPGIQLARFGSFNLSIINYHNAQALSS